MKIFVTISKTDRSDTLISGYVRIRHDLYRFNPKSIKFLQDSLYDVYLMRDTDAATMYMALSLGESTTKSKKRLL